MITNKEKYCLEYIAFNANIHLFGSRAWHSNSNNLINSDYDYICTRKGFLNLEMYMKKKYMFFNFKEIIIKSNDDYDSSVLLNDSLYKLSDSIDILVYDNSEFFNKHVLKINSHMNKLKLTHGAYFLDKKQNRIDACIDFFDHIRQFKPND